LLVLLLLETKYWNCLHKGNVQRVGHQFVLAFYSTTMTKWYANKMEQDGRTLTSIHHNEMCRVQFGLFSKRAFFKSVMAVFDRFLSTWTESHQCSFFWNKKHVRVSLLAIIMRTRQKFQSVDRTTQLWFVWSTKVKFFTEHFWHQIFILHLNAQFESIDIFIYDTSPSQRRNGLRSIEVKSN
jgi:hypothetical protein